MRLRPYLNVQRSEYMPTIGHTEKPANDDKKMTIVFQNFETLSLFDIGSKKARVTIQRTLGAK